MPTTHAPAPRSAPHRDPRPAPRHDLPLYFVLAFLVAWGCWGAALAIGGDAMKSAAAGPYLLGAFAPLIAAFVVRVRRRRRGEPVPAYVVRTARGTLWRAPLLLLLGAATVVGGALLAHAAGEALSLDSARDALDEAGPAAFLVSMVVAGPLSEEAGWRGTAYPRLRERAGRVPVALVLGVVWAVWHLPLFFIEGTVQKELGLFTPGGLFFALSNIPMAMLCCFAYERAGIVASMAVHFAVNTSMVLLDVKTPATQALIVGMQALVLVGLYAGTWGDGAAGGAGTAGTAGAGEPGRGREGARGAGTPAEYVS
ncbi:CPBP family intramembrane glutamic endopeptidase [Streptomyces sp. SID11385]|uniref:CPBP family intramembrane glutamic endopeptidase n=1 Tax=Streptomyces sp. SID11385 TaxID=2706031 RepID=UPI0013C6C6ED|nr:CPBP family intramembrane glutamic endopeptidase [Streptomyces sp. SID11385]NEA42515.1 CPBP family intramembrane metalloprotease [Streptomyces sp. SID11385]